jgi:hypothetical protein
MRLSLILEKNPNLLHESQRGFIRNGNTAQAINIIVDIIETYKTKKKPLFVVSYDQKKAYDSVQHFTIAASIDRFNLPENFKNFVLSSMEGATSTINTDEGEMEPFELLTSVKQGDPLSPLLYILISDALLEGFDIKNGVSIGKVQIAATAYADDITVVADNFKKLREQHKWLTEFFQVHGIHLNTRKSSLHTTEEKREKFVLNGTAEDKEPIPCKGPRDFFRHLGLHLNLELDWSKQIDIMEQQIRFVMTRIMENGIDLLNATSSESSYCRAWN